MRVLFLSVDQWRGDFLGYAGHPTMKTPHLDQLADEGVAFLQHYAVAAPCGPSRTSMLTGLYPQIHRSIYNGAPLHHRFENIASLARAAGLRPQLLGYTDTSADPASMAAGDARLKSYEGVMPGFHQVMDHNESMLFHWRSKLERAGFDVGDASPSALYAHAEEASTAFPDSPAHYDAAHSDTAHMADSLIDFLQIFGRDEDFFAHAVFLRPHPPLVAPMPYHSMYDGLVAPALDQPEHASDFELAWRAFQAQSTDYYDEAIDMANLSPDDVLAMRRVYMGLASEVDHHLGRVMDCLKAQDIYDETLIIMTCDHGEMLGDYGLWGKMGFYDQAFHIPLIIKPPKSMDVEKGRKIHGFTENVDVMATLADYLGLDVPADVAGVSLRAAVEGAPFAGRPYVNWMFDYRLQENMFFEQSLKKPSEACLMQVLKTPTSKIVLQPGDEPLFFQKEEGQEISVQPDLESRMRLMELGMSHMLLNLERGYANMRLGPNGPEEFHGPRQDILHFMREKYS